MPDPILPRAGVCDVDHVRGAAADTAAPPDLVLEVPHGATRSAHFTKLRTELRGEYAADLHDFFCVNTDVGAPELAHAIATAVVRERPRRSAVIVRCLLPRTFVDCNRRIDRTTVPGASRAGEMTPGLPPWIRDEADRALLLDRYFAYRDVATAAFAAACGNGGLGLCVHTYAPRSVEVPVDENIVASLRAAYAPDRVGSWSLRPSIDLITQDPDGRELAAPQLAQRVAAEAAAAGFDVARNGAYSLHAVTLAHEFATRYPDATLCFEVRRDLLVPEFTPFREMIPDAAKVARAAAPFAAAVAATLR
jgi:hypothetical protein